MKFEGFEVQKRDFVAFFGYKDRLGIILDSGYFVVMREGYKGLEFYCDKYTSLERYLRTGEVPDTSVKYQEEEEMIAENKEVVLYPNKNAWETLLKTRAKEDIRPILTRIHIDRNDVVSTDGYRLAKFALARSSITGNFSPHLAEFMKRQKTETTWEYDGKTLRHYNSGLWVVCDDMPGKYPDYGAILPHNFEFTITLKRGELLKACQVAQVMARDNANSIRLTFQRAEVSVYSQSPERGDCETLLLGKQTTNNKTYTISCNVQYLIDALKQSQEEYVTLQYVAEDAPLFVDNVFIMPMTR